MSSTALELIQAARILTQAGLTIQQLGSLLQGADSLTEEEVDNILAKGREKILENATN